MARCGLVWRVVAGRAERRINRANKLGRIVLARDLDKCGYGWDCCGQGRHMHIAKGALPSRQGLFFTLTLPPLFPPAITLQVLVKTDAEIVHTVKGASPSPQGFFMACAELWAFSLTDYHVLTRKSGYGKVGAMVNANGEKHVFTIDFPMQVGGALWLACTARAKEGRA